MIDLRIIRPWSSFFAAAASVTPDAEKRLPRKAIKHAHFNEAWIRGGDAPASAAAVR